MTGWNTVTNMILNSSEVFVYWVGTVQSCECEVSLPANEYELRNRRGSRAKRLQSNTKYEDMGLSHGEDGIWYPNHLSFSEPDRRNWLFEDSCTVECSLSRSWVYEAQDANEEGKFTWPVNVSSAYLQLIVLFCPAGAALSAEEDNVSFSFLYLEMISFFHYPCVRIGM